MGKLPCESDREISILHHVYMCIVPNKTPGSCFRSLSFTCACVTRYAVLSLCIAENLEKLRALERVQQQKPFSIKGSLLKLQRSDLHENGSFIIRSLTRVKAVLSAYARIRTLAAASRERISNFFIHIRPPGSRVVPKRKPGPLDLERKEIQEEAERAKCTFFGLAISITSKDLFHFFFLSGGKIFSRVCANLH